MPRPRVTAVIQARTGSTRLPGKVLRPLGASFVLGWVVRAAREAQGSDDWVIATTTQALDDPIDTKIERVARMVDIYGDADAIQRDIGAAIGEQRAKTKRWRALAGLCREHADVALERSVAVIGFQPRVHLLLGEALQMSDVAVHLGLRPLSCGTRERPGPGSATICAHNG